MKKLLILLSLLVLLGQAEAATYYVRKTGADGTRGCTNTGADACLTIKYGIGKMAGGDTLNVGDGTYNEEIFDYASGGNTRIPAGTSGQRTIIKAQTRGGVTLTLTSPSSGGWVWYSDQNWVELDGFNIIGTTFNGAQALQVDGNDNYYHHLDISNNKGAASSSPHCSFIRGTGNIFSYITFHDCRADNYNALNKAAYDAGINTIIEHSSAVNIYPTAGNAMACPFLAGSGTTPQSTGQIYRFNTVDVRGMGAACGFRQFEGSGQIYGNVVIGDSTAGSYGIIVEGLGSSVAYNNTVYNVATGIYLTTNANTYRNNIFFGGVGISDAGSNTQSNNACSTGCALDTDNYTASQIFVNAPAADFRLQLGSPAINAGVNLGSPYNLDIAGIDRGATWDIGAYESAASHALAQTHSQFYSYRNNGTTPVLKGAQDANTTIQPNGAARIRLKLSCTLLDCPIISPTLYYSRNDGSYTVVPNSPGTDHIAFAGTADTDPQIPSGIISTELLTSDYATNVNGAYVRTSAETPSIDLLLNSESENEYMIALSGAVLGNTYDFRLYDGSGNPLNSYPATPRLTVVNPELQITGF